MRQKWLLSNPVTYILLLVFGDHILLISKLCIVIATAGQLESPLITVEATPPATATNTQPTAKGY